MQTRVMASRLIIRLFLALCALGMGSAPVLAQVPPAFEVDLLEVHLGKGEDHLLFDSTLTAGEGDNQLLVKVAGGSDTRTGFDDLEVQGLYSRSLSKSAQLHFGVRHDIRPGSNLTHGVAGLVVELRPGLDAEHYFFVSQHGNLTGSAQVVWGLDVTPKLVLEPRVALGWSAQAIPGEDLGQGVTDIEASLRLRRSLGENFNLYTGIVHERLVGPTRSIALAAGDPSRVTRAIVGLGLNF